MGLSITQPGTKLLPPTQMAEESTVLTMGDLFMIHDLRQQGLSINAISKRTGMDRKTVRKYLQRGPSVPVYGPRAPRPCKLDPYLVYLDERVDQFPELSGSRLLREIKEMGYTGGYSLVTDYLRDIRPPASHAFERRFETPAGKQAQVDFAQFKVCFGCEPLQPRIIWLFSMVLGCSRYLYLRYVWRQTLDEVVRCHIAAFEEFGGVPREILYDRMKTAVIDEDDEGVNYNPTLMSLASHYGFQPRACRPYRAKTKGKVERPFRYVRQDFFLGRSFYDLEDLNAQLDDWRHKLANSRVHGTTGRVVNEAFADEQPQLKPLPAHPFNQVLKLERRISRDGMVSVGGNDYSVPDTTRSRKVEVQQYANEVQLFEDRRLIAVHPLLTGRGQRQVLPGHRIHNVPTAKRVQHTQQGTCLQLPGHAVHQRPLAVYEAIGQALAGEEVQ
jgi:transposase